MIDPEIKQTVCFHHKVCYQYYDWAGMMQEERRRNEMKLSARNQLKGTITSIKTGAVNCIVTLDIGGGNTVTSTISINAVEELGLKVGMVA